MVIWVVICFFLIDAQADGFILGKDDQQAASGQNYYHISFQNNGKWVKYFDQFNNIQEKENLLCQLVRKNTIYQMIL